MYSEDQLLPISALQHLLFCERQCALIHVEQEWAENRFTVEGHHLHRKSHKGREERCDNVRVVRGLWVRSTRLGLVGRTDIVEIRSEPGRDRWRLSPIEYKRGRPKENDCDRVQLCAQAMCLEEMLNVTIELGAIFYGKRQRRTPVAFDHDLRAVTEAAARRLQEMFAKGETPRAVRSGKCDTCSLLQLCLPDVVQASRSASRYVSRQFAAHLRGGAPETDP